MPPPPPTSTAEIIGDRRPDKISVQTGESKDDVQQSKEERRTCRNSPVDLQPAGTFGLRPSDGSTPFPLPAQPPSNPTLDRLNASPRLLNRRRSASSTEVSAQRIVSERHAQSKGEQTAALPTAQRARPRAMNAIAGSARLGPALRRPVSRWTGRVGIGRGSSEFEGSEEERVDAG